MLIVALGGVIATVGMAQNPNGPVLDGIGQQFQTAARSWLPKLLPIAQRTFTLLATLEFIISGITWMLQHDSLDDVAGKVLTKFILLSFVLTCITSFDYWLPAIISGFTTAGEQATGLTGLSPSGVLDLGWRISGTLLSTVGSWNGFLNPVTSLFIAFMAFGIWIAFVLVAAYLLRVLVESYIVLTGGVLFLGLAGFRATAGYAENYINYAVNVGVRVFLVYLVVGVGLSTITGWSAMLAASNWNIGGGDSSALGQVFGGAVLFAYLALTIPATMAARITGNHSLGIAQALRTL